jgi:hypothetical protein
MPPDKSRARTIALSTLRWGLMIWGGVSLLGVAAFLYFSVGAGNRDHAEDAKIKDVRFVLNWSGLSPDRIERIVHSYRSARSLQGDHLEAYAIKVSRVEAAELLAANQGTDVNWYRGDQLSAVADLAVKFAGSWHELSWFPSEAELRSTRVFVHPWSVTFHGASADAAEIIFVRPDDNMVFFFGGKV